MWLCDQIGISDCEVLNCCWKSFRIEERLERDEELSSPDCV